MTQARVEVIKRQNKDFEVLPKRWIVERTFGWMNYRSLLRRARRFLSFPLPNLRPSSSMLTRVGSRGLTSTILSIKTLSQRKETQQSYFLYLSLPFLIF